MSKRKAQLDRDLFEVHQLLTRVILFLDRNNFQREVQCLLRLKTELPVSGPHEKKGESHDQPDNS